MGIPIDGEVNKFKKALERKGLRYYTQFNNQYVFKGVFAGDEANIFVMYDIKTKVVYGIGVNIKCLSHQIAKDKYYSYVNNLKDKYETDKWDRTLKYYSENQDSLFEHVLNGTFKRYNRSFVDSVDTEFLIKVSEITLSDKEKENKKSLINAMLGLKLILESDNIGTIGVKCEYNEDSISIFYRDEQNVFKMEEKMREDL